MSKLGNKITQYHLDADKIADKVVDYYMNQFKTCNEGLESVDTFTAIACCEDDNNFWEELCYLSDCNKEYLSDEVGVSISFPSARTCHIRYSGK